MICKKCNVDEMNCDCPQWSPEAQAILKARALLNAMPVPTKKRMMFDPRTGEFIGPVDAD